MICIPAIDLLEGKAVRLTQGEYNSAKVYAEDPVVLAKTFEDAGCTHLHLVDLDGARMGAVQQLDMLKEIARQTSLSIDFSGGLSELEHIEDTIEAGATWVGIGSKAVTAPSWVKQVIETIGADRVLLSADARDGHVATKGWTQTSPVSLIDHIQAYLDAGITRMVVTDIGRDGMLQGPSIELYKSLLAQFGGDGLDLIASGGISGMNDLESCQAIGCTGVVIGKAYYEGHLSLEEIVSFEALDTDKS
ncbi:MAG: 1-(5-phosphoribosyl)-5-[(5-phosphoribosylamino)methylideneamino] imidazole-4-carboxamide isomerase [Balneolaceae bacterium]|nr:1-(5-phosphoribosyl)-5-[(5-phosphoribosylamino)methylideneamino] imidazole-4-carboxamide isomerase [Balneolaceae bacterium]MDR9446906.1 1-(5-phosphoribosyl)-5-[(5-phosphoribosylamino)methylideneamino] imidazole-4-carboxamide isomerase [Balneolaceae bacterium]